MGAISYWCSECGKEHKIGLRGIKHLRYASKLTRRDIVELKRVINLIDEAIKRVGI